MAGAQVPRGPGSDTLEALPVAFSATGWQRCVLRSPPPEATFPMVGEMAQCWHGPAICDIVPRCWKGGGAAN